MKKNEMICIVCPIGCHLSITGNQSGYVVQGNQCPRGWDYAVNEYTNPRRMVTSTVKVSGAVHGRLPVKTSQPFPKGKIMDLMAMIHTVEINTPVKLGQVILANVLDSGIDLVATRTI